VATPDDQRIVMVNGVPMLREYVPEAYLQQMAAPPVTPIGETRIGAGAQALGGAVVDAGSAVNNAIQGPPLANRVTDGLMEPAAPPPPPAQTTDAPLKTERTTADFVPPKSKSSDGKPQTATTTETQTTTQRGVKPSKAALDKQDAAYTKEEATLEQSVALGQKRAAEELGYLQARDAGLAAQEKRRQADEAIQRTDIEHQNARVQDAIADFRTKKVDPNKIWEGREGARVVAAIAQGLGALGAGLAGTRNFAGDMIEQAVQRSIAAQEREIESAKENVNLENNVLSQLRQRGLDQREAHAAARAFMFERAEAQIEEVAAKYKSQGIRENAETLLADLRQRRADAGVALSTATQDRVTTTRHEVTAPVQPASGTHQLPAGEAAKLGEANAAANNVEQLYSAWNKDAKGVWAWLTKILPGTDADKYEDKKRAAAQVIGTYLEGGKLTETDLERYMKMLPSAGEWEGKGTSKKDALVNLIATRQRGQKQALSGSGYNVAGIKDAGSNVTTFKRGD
jgi:hypothetical protein